MSVIWDSFFFNDELDLLEVRLHELAASVDHIVIVEGDRTYSGRVKPLVFAENRGRFRPWADKITHVVARLDPGLPGAWDRENQQRAILGSFLSTAVAPDDIVLLGDIDEIPDRDAFGWLQEHRGPPVRLRQHHAVYYANWLMPRPWSNSTLAFRGNKFSDAMVRLQLGDNHKDWDGYREVHLAGAGVHLSFLGGVGAIRTKLASYAHQEFTVQRFSGAPHLERCVEFGVHFQGRDVVRRLRRDELDPLLRRLSEQPAASMFFDFRAPAPRVRARAYCGYTWLRTRARTRDGLVRFVDRHPGAAVGAGAPLFWAVDAALRARRRLRARPDWVPSAEFARGVVTPPTIERWR